MATPDEHDHSGELLEEVRDDPLPEGVEGSDDDEPGGPYLRKAGEVLIAAGDVDEAAERLVGQEHRIIEPESADLPVALAYVEDVRRAMEQIHQPEARRLDAAPNHLFHPAPGFRWRTFEAPRPGHPRPECRTTEAGVARVAVLDTGAADHSWFGGRVDIGPNDHERPDEDGDGRLDANRGHGTFVAGVVLAHAPAATVRVLRVPEVGGASGLIDDLALATALLSLDDVDVINLSLGGTTRQDVAPPATAAALAVLRERAPDTVVVAAAGNDGWSRPSWPAALKGVLAVGALNREGRPASFSNRGWWVDVWANGVDVRSTFFDWRGPLEHPLAPSEQAFDSWALWCGTSFAAPRITGAIATATEAAGSARRAAFDLLFSGRRQRRLDGVLVDLPEPD
jgi:hypothetical protein